MACLGDSAVPHSARNNHTVPYSAGMNHLSTFALTFTRTAIVSACLAATIVQAEMGSPDPDTWKVELSVGAVRGTQSLFKGVLLQSRIDPLIGIELAKGRWFASSLNGVGYLLANSPSISVGVSANYMLGRKESRETRYRGLGDVAGSAAANGFFEWRPVKNAVTVYGNVLTATRSQNGTLATLGATVGLPVTTKLSAFIDIYANWADTRYAQAYYGVSAAQSAASGYVTYTPKVGMLSRTPSVGLDYEWDKHWHVSGYVGATKLASFAANSPVVANRSQPVAAVLVTYKY